MVRRAKQYQKLRDRVEQLDKLRKSIDGDLDQEFGTAIYQKFFNIVDWVHDEADYQIEVIGLMRPLCKSDMAVLLLDKLEEDIARVSESSSELDKEWITSYDDDKAQYFREVFRTTEKAIDYVFRLQTNRMLLKSVCDELDQSFRSKHDSNPGTA